MQRMAKSVRPQTHVSTAMRELSTHFPSKRMKRVKRWGREQHLAAVHEAKHRLPRLRSAWQ